MLLLPISQAVMGPSHAYSDEATRAEWEGHEPAPIVFIAGLHRSGTTFLYESLSVVLPVAKLTLSNVVNFDHLIRSHVADGGRADQQAIAEYLAGRQTHTRGADSLSLSPSTAEEYGWILKKRHGSFHSNDRSLRTLQDLICKLAYIHSNARAILLKNPWDTRNAPYLAKRFPSAKFVFIRREPIEVLNSELTNLLHFSGTSDALLALLTKDITSTRWLLALFRILRGVLGTRLFSRLGLWFLTADVVSKLKSYDVALAAMPRERVIEVSYRDLVEDPQHVLRSIGAFLDLPVADSIRTIAASSRRGGISPLVRSHEERLAERMEKAGLSV